MRPYSPTTEKGRVDILNYVVKTEIVGERWEQISSDREKEDFRARGGEGDMLGAPDGADAERHGRSSEVGSTREAVLTAFISLDCAIDEGSECY